MLMSQHIVRMQDASIFQGDKLILQQVNVRIRAGEFTYLIGKTGSGKTSLLKVLYAALPLRKGAAEVAGFDLTRLNRNTIPRLRKKLGIVFQDFNLLSDRNVADNLDFVLRATGWKDKVQRAHRINMVLEQVGLASSLNVMPHQLSGGEQQRIVIARALINSPEIIIADEPTGNLDPDTSDDILQLLRDISKQNNTAVLFATHDYRILETFPARIIRCVHGRIFDDQEIG
jgi:cell division transport system ATP-binding protein